jgi:biotin transport system substrate-specific component
MTTIATVARTPRTRALSIIFAAGALALAAQFALPVPGTPVPITLQGFVVVLAGLLLGPADAAVAMVVYLIAGAAGLPVFSPFGAPGILRLFGPTGGYLLAYPLAAAVAGRLGMGNTSFVTRALAAVAGMCVIHLGGLAQLALLTGSFSKAVLLGITPFVAVDAVKALLAAALSSLPLSAAKGARRGGV